MSESNVAQDQIKAYVDRILRMKDEADAIASDIKEIYAEARGNGFDKTQLGNLVTYLRKKDKDGEKLAEGEAIFALYLEAYYSAKGQVGTRRATHTHASEDREARSKARLSEAMDDNKSLSAEMLANGLISEEAHAENVHLSDAVAEKLGAGAVKEGDPLAALRADPAMAIVEAANITPKTQPTKAAGSDLTSLAPHEGQVAPIQPETADQSTDASKERAQTATGLGAGGDNLDQGSRPTATAKTDVPYDQGQASGGGQSQDNSGVRVASVEPKYAESGVVVWEHTPPEPVRRHPYSVAFGDLGQDLVVIDDDIAGAKSDPIVRIGNEILDGWARYNVARGMIGGSGMSTEYPVMQYAGTDPLLDCIRMNVAGRVLSPKDKQTVAQRLIAIEPKRKAEILKALSEMAA